MHPHLNPVLVYRVISIRWGATTQTFPAGIAPLWFRRACGSLSRARLAQKNSCRKPHRSSRSAKIEVSEGLVLFPLLLVIPRSFVPHSVAKPPRIEGSAGRAHIRAISAPGGTAGGIRGFGTAQAFGTKEVHPGEVHFLELAWRNRQQFGESFRLLESFSIFGFCGCLIRSFLVSALHDRDHQCKARYENRQAGCVHDANQNSSASEGAASRKICRRTAPASIVECKSFCANRQSVASWPLISNGLRQDEYGRDRN